MNLQKFFSNAQKNEWWDSHAITCFLCNNPDNATFFLSMLSSFLEKKIGKTIQNCNTESVDEAKIIAMLSCSFLGMKSTYWLKRMHSLDVKKRSFWIDYFSDYNGVNSIIICLKEFSKKSNDQMQFIELNVITDLQEMAAFISFFIPELSLYQVKDVARELFKRRKSISLDMASLVVKFLHAIGFDMVVLRAWLDDSLLHEQSLFSLSGYFFNKDMHSFFRSWQACSVKYPEIFWVSYWFDILWRAYYYISYMQNGESTAAKKIGVRLPFSFIQRDWQFVQLDELKNAITLLSTIDADLKSGMQISYGAFEVFFLQFFYARKNRINRQQLVI